MPCCLSGKIKGMAEHERERQQASLIEWECALDSCPSLPHSRDAKMTTELQGGSRPVQAGRH